MKIIVDKGQFAFKLRSYGRLAFPVGRLTLPASPSGTFFHGAAAYRPGDSTPVPCCHVSSIGAILTCHDHR